MNRTHFIAAALLASLGLTACNEDKSPDPKETPSAKDAKASDGDTKPTKAKDEPKPEAKPAKGLVDGLPAAVAGKLKLPGDFELLEDDRLPLVKLMVPKGMKLPPKPKVVIMTGDEKKKWTVLSDGKLSLAWYDHNPASDDSPNCKSMDEMKKLVSGAKTLHDFSFSMEPVEEGGKTRYFGDEVKLWMFEKDGKVGFYGIKVFDHGDDATTVCVTPGTAQEAPKLAGRVDRAGADALAASFMSIYEQF